MHTELRWPLAQLNKLHNFPSRPHRSAFADPLLVLPLASSFAGTIVFRSRRIRGPNGNDKRACPFDDRNELSSVAASTVESPLFELIESFADQSD